MLSVGVIDRDETVVGAMLELWRQHFQLRRIEPGKDDLGGLDVLVADLATLEGHALSFLHELRSLHPSLKLVLTFVYCDSTQAIEEEIHSVADACVLKPFDFESLAHTVQVVAQNPVQVDRPSDARN